MNSQNEIFKNLNLEPLTEEEKWQSRIIMAMDEMKVLNITEDKIKRSVIELTTNLIILLENGVKKLEIEKTLREKNEIKNEDEFIMAKSIINFIQNKMSETCSPDIIAQDEVISKGIQMFQKYSKSCPIEKYLLSNYSFRNNSILCRTEYKRKEIIRKQ